jgi:peptidoglycan/LPS O-acetylase OafA/YrhL
VRGIAAVTVVVHHCLFTFVTTGFLGRVALLSENAATSAVVFFFVLSGFVLTLSLQSKPLDLSTVLTFYVRRA